VIKMLKILHDGLYTNDNLDDHNLKILRSSKLIPMDPSKHRQLIGLLMYLVNTRPDICFAVNVLS